MKQTSSLCRLCHFVICEPCLVVFFRVYTNTALSSSLHLLVDGGLALWALPIQVTLSAQFILLSLALSVQSVNVLAWRHSSIQSIASPSRRFITSCRVLAYKASFHSSRMLCWFSIPQNIGCGLNSLLYLPPSPGQLRGVCSVAAEEEHRMGGSDSSFISSQIISLINNSYSSYNSSQVVCPSSDGGL